MYFVDAVDNCKTFDDVKKLAEDILGYCKEELKKKPEIAKNYKPVKSKGESDMDSNDSESSSSMGDDDKDALEKWLDKKDQEENKDSDKKDDDKESDQKGNVGGNGAGGEPSEIRSLTNEAAEDAIRHLADNEASERNYCELPEVDLKKLIIPYKKFIRDIMIYDKQNNNT